MFGERREDVPVAGEAIVERDDLEGGENDEPDLLDGAGVRELQARRASNFSLQGLW